MKTSGITLRLAAVSLDSGSIRYVTEAGRLLETDQTPVKDSASVNDLVVSLVDGIIASSAIPCGFAPVRLGTEMYVDGGIRWVLPLKAAIDLHPDRIFAINASPLGVPPARIPYATANLLDIAERSVFQILLVEAEERHLEVARKSGISTFVIAPRQGVDVHDSLTVDPGLLRINMGYGYMRAADILGDEPIKPRCCPFSRRSMPQKRTEVCSRPSCSLTLERAAAQSARLVGCGDDGSSVKYTLTSHACTLARFRKK